MWGLLCLTMSENPKILLIEKQRELKPLYVFPTDDDLEKGDLIAQRSAILQRMETIYRIDLKDTKFEKFEILGNIIFPDYGRG
jgi:hypothetical protein